jgi:hypothetical protein
MRASRKWLLGGALSLLLAGTVLAQIGVVTQNSLSGNEVWRAAQSPGGPEQYIGLNQVRNGSAMLVVPSVSGNPVTTLTQANSTVYWAGTAPTTWTVNLPVGPFDGEIVTVGTDTTLTSMVTVVAGAGSSLNTTYASQTISAKTSVEFQYSAGTTKWYELR